MVCDACSANKNVFNCDNVSKAKLNPWYIHYFSKIGLIEFRLEGFLPRFVHRISLQGVQNSFGDNYCLWLRAWSLISWVRVTNEFHSRYCYIYLVERWTDEETFAVMAPETTTDPESRREAGATALANVWPLVGFLVGSLGIVKLRRWLYVQVWFTSQRAVSHDVMHACPEGTAFKFVDALFVLYINYITNRLIVFGTPISTA